MGNDVCNPSLSLIEAIKAVFTNPTFSGRARRSEFWWFFLFFIIVSSFIIRLTLNSFQDGKVLGWIGFSLCAILIYFFLTVNVRRFHDIGHSGLWIAAFVILNLSSHFIDNNDFQKIFYIIKSLASLNILILCCIDGGKKENKYGLSPKYSTSQIEKENLEQEIEENIESFKDKLERTFDSFGCLIPFILIFGTMFGLTRWLCDIDPAQTYCWYHGIWHGLFIIPNWIISLFNHDILCKAELYSTGYNIWWWIMLIWEILSILNAKRY